MRWFLLSEGYKKAQIWINLDEVVTVRFSQGADGRAMAYVSLANDAEMTTHLDADIGTLQKHIAENPA